MTFDGLFYDLNGACAYLLAKDCESNRFNVSTVYNMIALSLSFNHVNLRIQMV